MLLVHDIFGRTDFYEHIAGELAAEGFLVLIPDLFFQEGPLESLAFEEAAARRLRFDERQALANLELLVEWLGNDPRASGRIATLGFCMGGTLVLDLAAAPHDIATVCFYGFPRGTGGMARIAAPAPLDVAARMRGPILGFWGKEDRSVDLDDVAALDKSLHEGAVDHEFILYEGAGHGFLAGLESGDDASRTAAQDAWKRTLAFLSAG